VVAAGPEKSLKVVEFKRCKFKAFLENEDGP